MGEERINALIQVLREAPGLPTSVARVDWLSGALLAEAVAVGEERLQVARARNRTQPFGDPGDEKRLEIDRWSCIAELAVATYLGLPWVNVILQDLSEKPPDVGDDIEVRWTSHSNGHLICHDADWDERIFVLVRGKLPEMWLCGWIQGAEAKKKEFQHHPRARNPADYWIPASELAPISTVPKSGVPL